MCFFSYGMMFVLVCIWIEKWLFGIRFFKFDVLDGDVVGVLFELKFENVG